MVIITKKGTYVLGYIVGLIIALIVLLIAWQSFPKIQRMIRGTEEIAKLNPKEIMLDANESYHNEYYEEAIRLYRDFLAKFPNHDEAFLAQFLIGESYFAMQEWNKARIAYIATRDNYELKDEWPGIVETKIFEAQNILVMEGFYTN